jgi:hypothetical protein
VCNLFGTKRMGKKSDNKKVRHPKEQ